MGNWMRLVMRSRPGVLCDRASSRPPDSRFASSSDYRETVIKAVRYGNDTDTTAAIAGGLAGTYWGITGIPSEWQRGLRDRHIPQELVDRLIETETSEWDGARGGHPA